MVDAGTDSIADCVVSGRLGEGGLAQGEMGSGEASSGDVEAIETGLAFLRRKKRKKDI